VVRSAFLQANSGYCFLLLVLTGPLGSLQPALAQDNETKQRLAFVNALSDQTQLAEIARQDHHEGSAVREAAINKLFSLEAVDQAVLATIAVDQNAEYYWQWRQAAAERVTDQTLLPRMARGGDERVRKIAMAKLTDQTLLATIAMEDLGPAGDAAFAKLTDQTALARIATTAKERKPHAKAVTRLSDETLLTTFAGNMDATTSDLFEALARLRLALEDPVISARVPNAELAIAYDSTGRVYEGRFSREPSSGEYIHFVVQQGSTVVLQGNWVTAFPFTVILAPPRFIPASVDLPDALDRFLGRAEFTQEDLVTLAQSHIREVRDGAKSRLAKLQQQHR
jgi:hypothetical protein